MIPYLWLPFGVISLGLSLVNLGFSLKGKFKHSFWLTFSGLSFALLCLLSEYHLVNHWVGKGDFSALEDVVPTISSALTLFVLTIILIHSLAFLIYRKSIKEA